MYKVTVKNYLNIEYLDIVKNNADGSITSIPTDEANTDYQAYLKWVEEGNLPYPSDFVEPLPTASVTPLPAETN